MSPQARLPIGPDFTVTIARILRPLLPVAGVAALWLVSIGTAAAQSWTPADVGDPAATAATVQWASGMQALARCKDGKLDVLLQTPEPVEAPVVFVLRQRESDEPGGEYWRTSANGGAIFARRPGRFARSIRKGGVLSLKLRGPAMPDREYRFRLPSGVEALDSVLNACNEAVAEPEREGRVEIARRPSGIELGHYYPPNARARNLSGVAAIDCIVAAEGRLTDCLAVDEAPQGESFGLYSAVVAEEFFRVRLAEGATGPLEGRTVWIPLRWVMGRDPVPPVPFHERVSAESRAFHDAWEATVENSDPPSD